MNEHDAYMADFLKVYETLEYWGPGSEDDTQKAFSLVPTAPRNILEIGCGKGLATKTLAAYSEANIIALDNEQTALDRLVQRFEQLDMPNRLMTVNASMTALPFANHCFDLIWAEGSAYIMGVENAIRQWKPFLQDPGYLVISDMVWRTDTPSGESIDLWNREYPDIQLVKTRIAQIGKAGYRVVEDFSMSEEAWLNYFNPLGARVAELEPEMPSSGALKDIRHEVNVCTQFAHEFGYHMFILANT
ncbi:MAG: class I SAM-dependent methyltransferase [Acidiferrobacterales bacterium]|nr:class I SAM-dependent methyltransferase [Acidiferrobacterales bacterium]